MVLYKYTKNKGVSTKNLSQQNFKIAFKLFNVFP